ncbi:hypothetical protein B488_10180 [Liberibacter crescens BT-1]|uniref:Uncharacterized protein n=1 Tax=Liberibacter crescens (strain BT-1) TaxID=1215343 RepID=L0EW00_LIBCB|nr:hypothetical protein [Liberibacter crescens]AGA65010.1 hypothetical protein B488_10180 [Liberibacter crescens BT-1]AMC13018.1 hypothetical protein RL73_05175 [Liberibacter crescens]
MSTPEFTEEKSSQPRSRNKKSAIDSEHISEKLDAGITSIKKDLKDIIIDVREFRSDIYTELKDTRIVYTELKNSHSQIIMHFQKTSLHIDEQLNNLSKKLDKLNENFRLTWLLLLGSMLAIILGLTVFILKS